MTGEHSTYGREAHTLKKLKPSGAMDNVRFTDFSNDSTTALGSQFVIFIVPQ